MQVDVIGPRLTPPTLAGDVITRGTTSPGWHVNVAWFAGVAMPAGFAAAEVIPERPARMLSARDPAARLAAVRAVFEAHKRDRPDDPRLVAEPAGSLERV